MSDRRSRRWFQLSLKSLFLLTLLVATFFAGYTLATKHAEETVRTEREARRAAEEELAQRADRTAQMRRLFGSGVDEPPWW